MRKLLFGLVPFVAIACTVSANVGDFGATAPDAGGEASNSDGGDGSAPSDIPPKSTDDGGTDGAMTFSDAGCGVSFPQRGSFIDVQVMQSGPPHLAGGAIVAGLYELTAMRVYGAEYKGTMQVRETLQARGSKSAGAFDRLTEARNATGSFEAYAAHGETITYEAPSGPALFVTPECPTKAFETTGGFETNANELIVFDDPSWTERVYRRLE